MSRSAEPKLAFSTLGCPDWSWKDILRKGPEFGFQGVEIRLLSRQIDLPEVPEFQPARLAECVRQLNNAGLAVCGLASSVRFDEPGKEARTKQLIVGQRYVDLAVALGASFVRVFGDVLPKGESNTGSPTETERVAALRSIADGLNRLGEYAEQPAVEILLETHGDFSSSRLVWELMQNVESPRVGVLWDTHHPWRFVGETLGETFERLRPWIRHTHWKDSVSNPSEGQADSVHTDTTTAARSGVSQREIDEAVRGAHALMSGHQHADYVLFGEGEFPIDECLGLLNSANYAGWYSLEWEKMWHPEIADPEIAFPAFVREMRERLSHVSGERN